MNDEQMEEKLSSIRQKTLGHLQEMEDSLNVNFEKVAIFYNQYVKSKDKTFKILRDFRQKVSLMTKDNVNHVAVEMTKMTRLLEEQSIELNKKLEEMSCKVGKV